MMFVFRWSLLAIALTVFTTQQVDGAAIPIWELLSHEEKMGRLFYVFVHLVQQYCKTSDIPDCPKVLTLYGLSNLVSEDDHSLDLMDPYQRDAKIIVWERIMRGEFKLPAKLGGKPSKQQQQQQQQQQHQQGGLIDDNDVYSTPYQVRVRPPVDFVAPSVVPPASVTESAENDDNESNATPTENQSKTLILRLGRSLPPSSEPLSMLPEQEAQWLATQFTL